MQTQIACPRCQTRFAADVHQLIDAQRTPQLKQMLLSGGLNVANCPKCGTSTQLAAPMLYHDADHQLLMVYVPMELNLPIKEQEKLVGEMTQAIVKEIPPAQFKGYLLQPQTIITMKTFMEKVFATEGITPEMLERQSNQLKLLEQLSVAKDGTAMRQLVRENEKLVDEYFFSLLGSVLQNLMQSQQGENQLVALSNLQAMLYMETEIGRQMERRQTVMRQLQKEAKAQGGLTVELFAKYLIENAADEGTTITLLQAGQAGINYELMAQVSNALEAAEAQKDAPQVAALTKLRDLLMDLYTQMQQQAQLALQQSQQILSDILKAPNTAQAVQERLEELDEGFMYHLAGQIKHAENKGEAALLAALRQVHALIMREAEKQLPPELQLINQLLHAGDESLQRQIVASMPPEARPRLAEIIETMAAEMVGNGDPAMIEQLERLQELFE